MPWLTPANPPDNQSVVRRILLPADNSWTSVFDGMLLDLCYARNWEQHGDMTPQETADWFWARYTEFTTDFAETPNSDSPSDLDGEPKLPWYENLYDWIIAGFLAITFTPQAAIVYQATVPKLRIAFRTGNIGALFKVLINGVEVWTGDSYGPIVDVIEQVFDTSAYTPPYTVRIEHNGSGEHVTGTAKLEYIRQDAVAAMVATILRADPEGCGIQWSQDNGDTWETIDLASCITELATDAANSAIQQAVTDGVIQGGTGQQGPTAPPSNGACTTYHAQLVASSRWLCPSPVNAGDTIQILSATGGYWDGNALNFWKCPTGEDYLLGSCSGGQAAESGDPLQTVDHMRLVGNIGSYWFDPLTDLYTVPAGVNGGQFFVQANDSNLADNQGQVGFEVVVCTGGIGWCHHFDFRTSDGGFVLSSGSGSWVNGQGWTATDGNGVYAINNFTGTAKLTRVKSSGTTGDTTHSVVYDLLVLEGGRYDYYNQTGTFPTNWETDNTHTVESAGDFQIYLGPTSGFSGAFVLKDLWIYGQGYNPFGSSNC